MKGKRGWITGLATIAVPHLAAAQAADTTGVQDIIVTAMRHASTVQKTAASIAVVSGDTLKATGTVDLPNAVANVPALQVQQSNTGATFYIRGIGSRGVGGDSPISVNIDGLYQQQPDVISGAFADIDRIEVLRGPQGTLYGRNANGGTINIITKDPQLGATSADITLGTGNYSAVHAGAAVNLPISSTLAVRLVGDLERHDGYLSNGLDDRNDRVLRGKLLWKPDDRLQVLLSVDHFNTDSLGPSNVLISSPNANPWYAAPYNTYSVVFTGDPVYCAPGCKPHYIVDSTVYRGQVDYDLDFATLTALVGVQRYRHDYLQDFAGGLERDIQPLHQQSYEMRLASHKSAAVQWVAGAYWLDQNWAGEQQYIYQIDEAYAYPYNWARSRALFGQVTVPLVERLRVVAGARYTWDTFRKEVDNGSVDGSTAVVGTLTPGTDYRGRYGRFTYKAGLEYDLARQALLYGQLSTGFRSGGVDSSGGPYGPETIKALEGGIKSRWFDGHLQLNAAGYYYFYNGYQLSYIISEDGAGSDVISTSNVPGTTRVWGAELESVLRPTHTDQVSLAVSWEGSRFANAVLPTAYSNGVYTYTDLTGRSLPRTPRWTVNGALEHTFDLGAKAGTLLPHVEAVYKTAYQSDITPFTYSLQKAYAVVNARLVYTLPDRPVSISIYVNNLTNKAVLQQANTAGPTDRYGVLSDPRTYGISLNGHFG